MIVRYEELVTAPHAVALECFERLGYTASDAIRARLAAETVKVRGYKSDHRYSCEDLALRPEQIATDYADIMEMFGYRRAEAD